MGDLIQMPARDWSPLLTKRQLANHLGRTPRWIEMRVAEGMPAEWDRHHRCRTFLLTDVQAWLERRRTA